MRKMDVLPFSAPVPPPPHLSLTHTQKQFKNLWGLSLLFLFLWRRGSLLLRELGIVCGTGRGRGCGRG